MKRREFITLLGGVAAWPLAARAEQPAKKHRIAVVTPLGSVADVGENPVWTGWSALFKELRGLGYVEGKNLIVQRYSGDGQEERFGQLNGAGSDRYIRPGTGHGVQNSNSDNPDRWRRARPSCLWPYDQCGAPGGQLHWS
jgi:hypothetical protein